MTESENILPALISAPSMETILGRAKGGDPPSWEVVCVAVRFHGTSRALAQCGQRMCWYDEARQYVDWQLGNHV